MGALSVSEFGGEHVECGIVATGLQLSVHSSEHQQYRLPFIRAALLPFPVHFSR